MIEPLLLTTSRVSIFFGAQPLTGAGGFFFERDQRLYLVTNRHVVIDQPSGQLPDPIEVEVHTDAVNQTRASVLSVALYPNDRGAPVERRPAAAADWQTGAS
jgi:S1-C subfamily serine protease